MMVWPVVRSVGVSDCAGLSGSLCLEIPSGATEPDRLAIEVRVPLELLGQLTTPADAPSHASPPASPQPPHGPG